MICGGCRCGGEAENIISRNFGFGDIIIAQFWIFVKYLNASIENYDNYT